MKTLTCILILSIFTINPCLGQLLEDKEPQSTQELYDFHIKKRRTNNAAGWMSLVTGLGLIAAGAQQNMNECLLSDCNNGMPLVYIGAGIAVSSIVWFENARSHKEKATIQLQKGAVSFNRDYNYPYVSATFSF